MLNDFLANGSLLAVLLMEYGGCVMLEAMRKERMAPEMVPAVVRSPMAAIFMFISIPCALWPAIYIGLYEGWLVGILSWVVLQAVGAVATVVLGIRGPSLGGHFLAACLAVPVGYYLSYSTL